AAQDVSVSKHASIRQQTLVLLNPPLDPFAAYFSIYREARGEPRPKHLYWLATGVDSIVVTGVDEHTLRLRPTRGFLASSSQRMLRSAASGFERDQEVRLEDCSIRVEELTLDRRPQAILVRFRSNLDDRALAFMTWQGPGYVAFVPPAPGQSVVIPRVDLWKALFG
ncbi:MAG TPA: hypothetical protein VFQ35_22420, partial [Polyangiaceae bacterium]|nr:hypothetical protein [Polyangiaceae bacterium]